MSSHKKHTAPENRLDNIKYHPLIRKNCDSYFIPESVRQYANEPLYILVAWWCLQQKGWLRRGQIAEAFRIPDRRASYLMAYLRKKTKRVVCEVREARMANNVYRYEILVTLVMPAFSRKKETSVSSPRRTRTRVGNAETSQVNRLWNQLINHRRSRLSEKKRDGND
ncbi:transcriptional regulator CaiF [Salmonella enterica subsp. enterica serovar Panama]|nr:transcriptional regulator CaiF [Salmonella enterica subsp. enterica serovar Panama]